MWALQLAFISTALLVQVLMLAWSLDRPMLPPCGTWVWKWYNFIPTLIVLIFNFIGLSLAPFARYVVDRRKGVDVSNANKDFMDQLYGIIISFTVSALLAAAMIILLYYQTSCNPSGAIYWLIGIAIFIILATSVTYYLSYRTMADYSTTKDGIVLARLFACCTTSHKSYSTVSDEAPACCGPDLNKSTLNDIHLWSIFIIGVFAILELVAFWFTWSDLEKTLLACIPLGIYALITIIVMFQMCFSPTGETYTPYDVTTLLASIFFAAFLFTAAIYLPLTSPFVSTLTLPMFFLLICTLILAWVAFDTRPMTDHKDPVLPTAAKVPWSYA